MQLVEWRRNHRFCGRCGTETVDAPGERATKCPECGLLAYPRLAPAVIMLVERDDGRALLARNANFPAGMFSCLAGFVEPGETLEHAVRREVMEEVGLAVGDVEFRGSQPWPFPHQVMIGFGAQYLSGEIEIDGQEIVEAQWFTPGRDAELPDRWDVDRRAPDRRVALARRLNQRGRTDHLAARVGSRDHVGVPGHVAESAVARRHRRRDDPADEERERAVDREQRPARQRAPETGSCSFGGDDAQSGHVLAERSAGEAFDEREVEEREHDAEPGEQAELGLVHGVVHGDDGAVVALHL